MSSFNNANFEILFFFKQKTAYEFPLRLVGSVRETGNLIRTKVLPDEEAVHQMAFGLCWDALKA